MKLGRRSTADSTITDADLDESVQLDAALASADSTAPKGRPTPKRRTNSTPAPPAPKTRKEAVAWQKQNGSRAKVAGKEKLSSAEYRQAMKSGDPTVLPRRDQGPVRALARDYVDSRRMASNYLLLLFPLMIIGYKIPPLQIVTLGLFVLLLLEWFYTGSRVLKIAKSRGLETREGAMAIGFYAGSRAYFLRNWRRPTPRVKMGEPV